MPFTEAGECLRLVRELMERSTRHSTFSGLSGILAGTHSIAGCLITGFVLTHDQTIHRARQFLIVWVAVALATIITDFTPTKRRAALVGRTIRSRLRLQIAGAASPELLMGCLLTVPSLAANPPILSSRRSRIYIDGQRSSGDANRRRRSCQRTRAVRRSAAIWPHSNES